MTLGLFTFSAAPEPLCPALKRRPAIRNPEPFSLPAFDEGGVFTFHGIEPQSLRDFWQEKIDDEYSGMYKKMKWDFWFFGESHQTRIWPENVEVCERWRKTSIQFVAMTTYNN